MPIKPFFSLQQILYRMSGIATQEARENAQAVADMEGDKPSRLPVTVRPETRLFLEAQAKLWGGSLASIAGTILDGVAAMEMKGANAALRGTAERLALVIEEHQLSYPGAAEVIRDLGITLGDLYSVEALRDKLTSEVLRAIATRFDLSYDWLAGKSSAMHESASQTWYKCPAKAAESLVALKRQFERIKLIIVTTTDADLKITDDSNSTQDLPHCFPVIQKERTLPGGEALVTYEIWEEGRWSYQPCRHDLKLVLSFAERADIYVIGKMLPRDDYRDLYQGHVLAATAFRAHLSSWHPDDYVPFRGNRPTLDPDDWDALAKYSETAFRRFDEIVGRERDFARSLT
ncbi:TPA: hypothetical protein ACYLN4_001088 [Burkholderia lata]